MSLSMYPDTRSGRDGGLDIDTLHTPATGANICG